MIHNVSLQNIILNKKKLLSFKLLMLVIQMYIKRQCPYICSLKNKIATSLTNFEENFRDCSKIYQESLESNLKHSASAVFYPP